MRISLPIAVILFLALNVFAASAPPPEAFVVMPPALPGPQITAYLKYQTELAWQQDDARRTAWQSIRTEQDLLRVQEQIRTKLLAMLGGLPTRKTPLRSKITGRIPMDSFHIEKLIFESLPGVYVTALVYVPDDQKKSHPAVLVPPGHAPDGKAHYQALCQHLVRRGYVVICWDPVGQGERSQFWDQKAGKSRYNLICAEHAVLGNLAYLAGTNLARWEIWDGIRAVDYLLTRPDVDSDRINITGTSGGGFQTALIAALDPRIKVAMPSCYITALPMRGDLLSLSGNGLDLSFSMFGEGEVIIDLGPHNNQTPVVTGATIHSLTGDLLELTLTGLSQHDVAVHLLAPPTEVVSTVLFSADTGSSVTDFVTNAVAQTISGTLSSALATACRPVLS